MNSRTQTKPIWFSTAAVLLVTIIAYIADQRGALTSYRVTLHDLLSPGRFVVAALSPVSDRHASPAATANSTNASELQNALLENELQRRQLVIENARLRNELRTARGQSAAQVVVGRSLVNFVATRAKVLSRTGTPSQLREMFLEAGTHLGLKRSELVVEGAGMVVDHGTADGVQPDQPVISGLAVVGRIASASRWVSVVQPVTDEEFSAAVQLVQQGVHESSYNARGMLEGTGDGLCRITGVPYTAAVAVGDEVYSADINGTHGPRLYFGNVVTAEFSAGGEWTIRVQPAFDLGHLNEVLVVHPKLDASRMK